MASKEIRTCFPQSRAGSRGKPSLARWMNCFGSAFLNRMFAVTTAFAVVAGGLTLEAASLVVSTTADSGAGSLRQAMQDANAAAGGSITFSAVTGTITLASELPAVSGDITITGPGAKLLKLSGNNSVRIPAESTGYLVSADGLEPSTHALKGHCSAS